MNNGFIFGFVLMLYAIQFVNRGFGTPLFTVLSITMSTIFYALFTNVIFVINKVEGEMLDLLGLLEIRFSDYAVNAFGDGTNSIADFLRIII